MTTVSDGRVVKTKRGFFALLSREIRAHWHTHARGEKMLLFQLLLFFCFEKLVNVK